MEVLGEEVKELVDGAATYGSKPVPLSFLNRARAVWSEEIMKAHQDRLSGQAQALPLLIQAGHW
jgi:hypothetical protein